MMHNIVKLRNVKREYDGKTVVSIDTFNIQARKKYLLLGKNGAGKTSLLYMISGLLKPTSGSVGIDSKVSKSDINFASSSARLNGFATVSENLFHFAHFYKAYDPVRIAGLLSRFGVSDLKDKKYYRLSDGEQSKINIIKSIIKKPKILLLDEVFGPIDLKSKTSLTEFLFSKELPKSTIISVEHNYDSWMKPFFDEMIIMKEGQIAYNGKLLSKSKTLSYY